MIRLLIIFFCLSISSSVAAQFGFQRIDTITVINGVPQNFAWAGGLDYPQFSNIDLNWDGTEDLFIFDRSCNKVLTFLHSGNVGVVEYVYAPQYEALFPEMTDWCLLVDYNCDGKKDIFTRTIGGGKVYKNIGDSGSGLVFELAKANLKAWIWGSESYMYISSVDIPAIVDIDGDSDIDLLTFGVGGTTVEYQKNLSMETYGHCDSLLFETKNLCWGKFRESGTDNSVTLNETATYPCNSPLGGEEYNLPDEREHAGSTLLALDMNNDGVMDLALGDISYPNMTLLMNGGTAPNQNSAMISQDAAFPSNTTPVNVDLHPAGFHVDIDNDGKRDLLVSPSSKIGSENRESVWYYDNTAADLAPVFNFMQNDFLQDHMIEVGSGALPVFFDHNGDGLKDLLVSNHGAYDTVTNSLISSIYYYQNTGTLQNPEFTFVTDDYQNISQLGLGNSLTFYPTFGDLDNDGDEDMILGEYTGYSYYFQNTGGAGNPAIFNTYSILNDNTATPIFESTYAYPHLVDLDRDNDLDLVMGKRSGKLSYYENTGNANVAIFTQVTTNLGDVDVSEWWTTEGHSIPQFLDIENEYHLVLGSKVGSLHYYDNIEGNLSGSWNLVDSTLEDIYLGTFSAPAIADLTNDNRFEMVLGNQRGGVGLYKSATFSDIGFEEIQLGDFTIYPNPSHGEIQVNLGNLNYKNLQDIKIQLFDNSGRLVMEVQANANLMTLNAQGLAKGLYILKVSGSQLSASKKVLFQ